MVLSEHKSNCLVVMGLIVAGIILLNVMNGMTVYRLARYRHTLPVLVLPDEKKRMQRRIEMDSANGRVFNKSVK
jgi:hypothetical protein